MLPTCIYFESAMFSVRRARVERRVDIFSKREVHSSTKYLNNFDLA